MAVEVAEIAGLGKGQGSLIYLRRRRALLEQELGQGQVLIEMLVLVLLVNLVLVLLVNWDLVLLVNLVLVLLVVLVWMTAVV